MLFCIFIIFLPGATNLKQIIFFLSKACQLSKIMNSSLNTVAHSLKGKNNKIMANRIINNLVHFSNSCMQYTFMSRNQFVKAKVVDRNFVFVMIEVYLKAFVRWQTCAKSYLLL